MPNIINSRMDFVLTLTKNTFIATALTVLAMSAMSIGTVSAETAKGAMLAKQANVIQPDTVIRAENLHPSANRSYKVAGNRYQPMTKVSSFSQTGNASWYGGQFHGRKTASGELYNMNALSAAHRTLPIPSYARVTNTSNGKSIIVRVNDRGPFHGNRVMDLSKAAAQQLGFISKGTAQVKIEQVVPGIKSASANTPQKDIYVDLKSFSSESDAQAYKNQTSQNMASAYMKPKVSVEKRSNEYVVRMGPFNEQDRADEAENRARSIAQTAI